VVLAAAVVCGFADAPASVPLGPELVLAAFPMLLLGALLILSGNGDDGGHGGTGSGDEPPWWPEFEREFRRYSRRRRHPVAGR